MPAEMTARRFPPPWTLDEHDECFIVRDADGQALGYFYFEEEQQSPHQQAAHTRRGAAHGGEFCQVAGPCSVKVASVAFGTLRTAPGGLPAGSRSRTRSRMRSRARPRRSGTRKPPCRRLTGRAPLAWRLHCLDWPGAGVLGVILATVREAGWLSLIFALAFALALVLEMAGGWRETTRRSRRRLLRAFSFAVGVIIFAAVAYREGWEAVLFLLTFLAIWQLASIKPAGD